MNKIHVVEFTSGTTAKTITGLFQWNFGQILQIKGLDLPSAVEVHFALRRSGEAIRRIGVTKDGVTEVEIPDVLFKTMMTSDYDIYAYVYVSDEEYGSTTHEIILKVKSRPMPDDVSDNFEKIMEAVKAIADGKVDKNQGIANNGKFLGVVDGYVALMDAPSGGTANAVQYVAQELTEEQQEQARANIGAANVTYDTETKTLNICLGGGTTNGLIEQIEDYVIENEIEKIVIDGVEVNLSRYAKKEETDRLSEQKVNGSGIKNIIALTQAEYDALEEKDATTLYIITDATGGDDSGSGDDEGGSGGGDTPTNMVPYLKSDGVAYVKLPHGHIDGTYEMCFRAENDMENNDKMFGNRYTMIAFNGGTKTNSYITGYYNGSSYAKFGESTIDISKKRIYTITDTALILDNDIVTEITAGTNTKNAIMYLFALNNSDQNNGEHLACVSAFTFFYLKIKDKNGNLLYHYKPAEDSEGVACIYEAVNKTYLYNAAESGGFVYGTELEES